MKYFLGSIFILSGVLHFFKSEFYLKLMPSFLPYPRELVYASGVAALVLGLLLIFFGRSRIVSWGAILYLIAVFPANVHMALHPEIFPTIPAWVSWVRLPFQGLLIYWAYRS